MAIKSYTSVAASNTALFPENMNPSAVNDGMRQVQADIRSWYTDAEWIDFGDSGISRASASSFKITSDVTSRYLANRRIKCYDATTLYGVITSSSYSAPDTTVNVTLDSGNLTTSLTSVAIGILSPTNNSIPNYTLGTLTVASTASISGAGVFKTTMLVEGGSTLSGTAIAKTSLICEGALIESKGTASSAGRLRLYEDSDNGTNYIEHIATASVAANRTVTWPDTDISGFLVQQVRTQTGAVATGTTVMPYDDTIPQNTEGDEYITLSITPKNTNNKLVIEVVIFLANSGGANLTAALFQDTTADAIAAGSIISPAINQGMHIHFSHQMTAGTTSATTFKVRAGSSAAGTTTFNGVSSARRFGGVMASSIIITEYSA